MGSDTRKLLKGIAAQGFGVTRTGKGHWLITSEGRRVALLAGTPSDRRSLNNTIAQLRRAGLVWPPQR